MMGGKDEGKDRSRRRSEAIKDRERDKGTSKELDTGHATCTYTSQMHITKRREMERGRESVKKKKSRGHNLRRCER